MRLLKKEECDLIEYLLKNKPDFEHLLMDLPDLW